MHCLHLLADIFFCQQDYYYRKPEEPFPWLLILILLFIILIMIRLVSVASRPSPPTANWGQQFPNVSFSSQAIYDEIQNRVSDKQYPGIKMQKVLHPEGGSLSHNREYLRIRRGRLIFDVCAAPFGKDFFISWWQARLPTTREVWLQLLPFLNKTAIKHAREQRYYEMDTETMFADSMKKCVEEVVQSLTAPTGTRQITATQSSVQPSAI